MRHERARELIVDGLVERLDAPEAAALQAHLAECAECAARADDHRRLWADLGDALVPEPSREGLDRLRATIALESGAGGASSPVRHGAPRSRRELLSRAAAIVVLLGAGALLGAWLQSLRGGDVAPVAEAPQQYLVMIHATTETPEQSQLVSDLMQGWIDSLASNGILAASQAFDEGAPVWIGPQQRTQPDAPPFFIVIRASSLQEAQQIAGTSPSLAWGGWLEVRAMGASSR